MNGPSPKRAQAFGPWQEVGVFLVLLGVFAGVTRLERSGATAEAIPAQAPSTSFSAPLSPKPAPEGAPPEPVVSYRLNARLDAERHRVEGSGSILLHNRSSRTLEDLYLHLYLNAFKNSETLFSRSPFQSGRGGRKPEEWGYCQIHSLSAAGHDLWASREYPLPNDETDVRVRLHEPLAPGQSLTLDVAFTSQLPEIVERTGYSRDYHMLAQWFPKLAKLEPNGEWAHFPFHPQSEFYANFGDYDVTVQVPEDFIVGASGSLTSDTATDGERRLRYEARGVHDFAWVAWPGFQVHETELDRVRVRLLYPEGHDANRERELAALRFGLSHYGERYGRYAYDTLTVVHPPRWARDAGGMEYPTLITTGGAWFAGQFSRSIELVTLHELAHQWFYGMVASDEHRFPFLDEGLASYAELVAAREWLGDGSAFDSFGLRVSVSALHRVGAARVAGLQNVGAAAPDFVNFHALGGLVYSRTATLLATLEGSYGEEAMRRALRSYGEEQRFRHPEPALLLAAIEAELGSSARSQAERALFERGTVDYRLEDFASVPTPGLDGLFGDELSATKQPGPGGYRSRAIVTRQGTLAFPVSVVLGYEDGTTERRDWDGEGDVFEVVTTSKSRAAWAHVDPERRVPLDDDLTNNARTLDAAATLRSYERLVYTSQLVARTLGP